jgi:hypothetical protein
VAARGHAGLVSAFLPPRSARPFCCGSTDGRQLEEKRAAVGPTEQRVSGATGDAGAAATPFDAEFSGRFALRASGIGARRVEISRSSMRSAKARPGYARGRQNASTPEAKATEASENLSGAPRST